MAIHPKYAEAIMSKQKQIEFRKRSLASDVSDILLYATAPIQKVVGRFRIAKTVCDTPLRIWDEYGTLGAISRADFLAYYRDSDRAYGFLVDQVERFAAQLTLGDINPRPSVPQSVSYLPASASPISLSEPGSLLTGRQCQIS
jgi:predicted transcriptional regulator